MRTKTKHTIIRVTGLLRYLHAACGQIIDTMTPSYQNAPLPDLVKPCQKCSAAMTRHPQWKSVEQQMAEVQQRRAM